MKIDNIEWNGKQITKPGMYSRVPMDIYHSQKLFPGPSVSSSGLRAFTQQSPKHFYAKWDGNPNRREDLKADEDRRHFILGRALHHLVLGEPFFAKLFVEEPAEYRDPSKGKDEWMKWSNNATVCKNWHKEQREAGKTVLKIKEIDTIKGMAAELSIHPFVQHGALNGLIERSIFWKDKKTGIYCKSRPDSIPTTSADFFDYKSTGSVRWRDLQRAIDSLGYHQQAALVRQGCREVLGLDTTATQFTFTLLFQEKTDPYCVRDVAIKTATIDLGERMNRAALDRMAECLRQNRWPGPGDGREGSEHIELSEFRVKEAEYYLEHPEEA